MGNNVFISANSKPLPLFFRKISDVLLDENREFIFLNKVAKEEYVNRDKDDMDYVKKGFHIEESDWNPKERIFFFFPLPSIVLFVNFTIIILYIATTKMGIISEGLLFLSLSSIFWLGYWSLKTETEERKTDVILMGVASVIVGSTGLYALFTFNMTLFISCALLFLNTIVFIELIKPISSFFLKKNVQIFQYGDDKKFLILMESKK